MGETLTHPCPGGCRCHVPDHLPACKRRWHRLPRDLRTPIAQTHRRDPGANMLAMADACDWHAANPPAAVGRHG